MKRTTFDPGLIRRISIVSNATQTIHNEMASLSHLLRPNVVQLSLGMPCMELKYFYMRSNTFKHAEFKSVPLRKP